MYKPSFDKLIFCPRAQLLRSQGKAPELRRHCQIRWCLPGNPTGPSVFFGGQRRTGLLCSNLGYQFGIEMNTTTLSTIIKDN